MANTHPTPVSFLRAAQLCILLVFSPKRFQEAEDADNEQLRFEIAADPVPRSIAVRRALFKSAGLVFLAGAAGFLSGLAADYFQCAAPKYITWLQIAGTCLLLWGTLFIRGWEIQSFGGITLSERVNQWIYRSLYCVGTAVLVASISWPPCLAAG